MMRIRGLKNQALLTAIWVLAMGASCMPDKTLYLEGNAILEGDECAPGKNFRDHGVFETTKENWPDILPRSYKAYFQLKNVKQEGPQNQLFVEEVEISYDFGIAESPSSNTLGAIPKAVHLPVFSHVPANSSSILEVELIPDDIGRLLVQDKAISDSSKPPGVYQMAVQLRFLARDQSGFVIEGREYTYPIELCENCRRGKACSPCYPPSQDYGCTIPAYAFE